MVPLMMKALLHLNMSIGLGMMFCLLNERCYGPRIFWKKYLECCTCITAFVLSGAQITPEGKQFSKCILDIVFVKYFEVCSIIRQPCLSEASDECGRCFGVLFFWQAFS
jgi:hypothetical protein